MKQLEEPKAIILETVETLDGRRFDQVRVVWYDLHLCQDIHGDDDRAITMAKRLAGDLGMELYDKRKR